MSYKKLRSSILALSVFLLMWVLYGWNFWNGDREAYELYYQRENIILWGVEIGYGYLNILANDFGLSFQFFQVCISFLTLVLLYRYVVKTTVSPFVFSVCFLFVFFPLDYVLMRNFLAFAVCLQGFMVLFENGRYAKAIYLFLIIIASMLHQSSIFFGVFVFMPMDRVVCRVRLFFWLFSCFSVYLILRKMVDIPAVEMHLEAYNTSIKSGVGVVLVHCVSLMFITLISLLEDRRIFTLVSEKTKDKELFFILNVNFLSLFFVPLYFESEIFIRLVRFVLFFNFVFCLNFLLARRKSFVVTFFYLCFCIAYLVLMFLVPVASLSVNPLIMYNLLI